MLHGHRRAAPLLLFAVALVGITLALAAQAASRSGASANPPLSVHSNDPGGARALRLWLQSLGYRPRALEFETFRLDPDAQILFILAPTDEVTREQADAIKSWAEAGGRVVVATEGEAPWLAGLGLKVSPAGELVREAHAAQPVFAAPIEALEVTTLSSLRLNDPAWVPQLQGGSKGDSVLAATRALGSGRITVLSSLRPLSTEGLRQPGGATFALSLIAGLPGGSAVVFDEYHHGSTEYGTLQSKLIHQPWGWAVLYAAGLCLLFLVLAGRRLGPPLPSRPTTARRSRAEYVETLGGMLHSSGDRSWLRHQYLDQVRHALGMRFQVRSDLPLGDFIQTIARQRPIAAELAGPLARLEKDGLSDREVVEGIRTVEMARARVLGEAPASTDLGPSANERARVGRVPTRLGRARTARFRREREPERR
jgi:hypothetical protein